MSTLTAPESHPEAPEATRPGAGRGPFRVLLRIHRTALWWAFGIVALATTVTVFLRWAAWAYPEEPGNCDPQCDTFLGFASAQTLLTEYVKNGSLLLLLLPLVVGAFVAGPVVARELETGLHRLTWTQSAPPARWLAAKLGAAAALATGGALALMGVLRIGAWNLFGEWNLNWPDRGVYEATGPALVAYCLLAVAVGALAGLLVRRTVAAMAAAGGVLGTVLITLSGVRWDLVPVRTMTGVTSTADFAPPAHMPANSFMTDLGVHNAAGERFRARECVPERIPGASCPTDVKITGWYLDYHPHEHFWYVQLIETGILLALTALAAYAAFRVLRRLHG
ncbi:ABC transporter permease [Streptomyces albidochromogenes]|uniref:ABC transporter permease n=1 Tax=Streptomyces albidochromogenes TaxID=329524 RepID=A0ABW6FHS4_9ACTN